jgi:pyruvate kinase
LLSKKYKNFIQKTMTQIIATIGPATESEEKIAKLVDEGVGFFRLNFSHGSHEWHKNTIKKLRKISPSTPLILDTKGPEMRTGQMPENFPVLTIFSGENLYLVLEEDEQDPENKKIFVNHPGLSRDVAKGDIISIDSGLIEVEVESVENPVITTRVLHGGEITSGRHVNLVKKDVSLPTITKNDEKDIRFGVQNGVDIIALSFLRNAKAVEKVRDIIVDEQKNLLAKERKPIQIWGKIESEKGVKNLEEIADSVDGLMVARGDLGVEMPLEEVPYIQKKILRTMKKRQKFSIVATEMMESMITHPRPTRAEVADVALAAWEGASAVMLSGETANGKYPAETVHFMKKVLDAAERHLEMGL